MSLFCFIHNYWKPIVGAPLCRAQNLNQNAESKDNRIMGKRTVRSERFKFKINLSIRAGGKRTARRRQAMIGKYENVLRRSSRACSIDSSKDFLIPIFPCYNNQANIGARNSTKFTSHMIISRQANTARPSWTRKTRWRRAERRRTTLREVDIPE